MPIAINVPRPSGLPLLLHLLLLLLLFLLPCLLLLNFPLPQRVLFCLFLLLALPSPPPLSLYRDEGA